MEIKLKKLTLENFKGFTKFEIEPNGKDVRILGANRSGKTTLADAYNWLLFNKDSLDNAEFGIKPLKNGEEQSLGNMVEAVLDVDGKELTLKKTHKEKWTKKRGQTNKTLTGHETDYEINDVPKKKKEFDDYIKELIGDIETFRLVSNPLYFNSLSTEKRRTLLMEVSGDVEDIDVIQSNAELSELEKLLENHTIDEIKARNKRDKKAVNDQLKSNPIRIDEINKNLMDVEGNPEKIKEKIEVKEKEKTEIQVAILDLKNGSKILDLKNKLRERSFVVKSDIDMKVSSAQNELDTYLRNFDEGTNEQLRKLKYKNEADKSDLSIVRANEKRSLDQLNEQNEHTDKLRNDYSEVFKNLETIQNERKEFEITTVCECCGQELPQEKIQEHRDQQQEKYNEERATKIKTLTDKLNQIKSKGIEEAKTADQLKEHHEKSKVEVERIEDVVSKNEEKIKELEKGVVKPEETEAYKQFSKSLEELLQIQRELKEETGLIKHDEEYKTISDELNDIEINISEQIQAHHDRLEIVIAELKELYVIQSRLEDHQRDLMRIEELKSEQSKLAAEYEKIESIEDKLNIFTTSKVHLVEERIADKFKYARFQLFKEQLNGGLEERCVTTFEGVPYDKGLNTEAKINVGLDIINTLAAHYDFVAPIIIDNAESVSETFETTGQQIKLTVSEENKTLKMEEI